MNTSRDPSYHAARQMHDTADLGIDPEFDPAAANSNYKNQAYHSAMARAAAQSPTSLGASSGGGGRFTEQWDASQRGSSLIGDYSANNGHGHVNGAAASNPRPQSFMEGDDAMSLNKRSNTLKKKASMRRSGSLRRSSSRRSMRAGSVRSLALQTNSDPDEAHSVFHCPVPTSGSPTDALANRFQCWRKILKDLIAYLRELVAFHEQRAKSLAKLSAAAGSLTPPAGFLSSGGLDDAFTILRNYNKVALSEAQRAKEIEHEMIMSLTDLRGDLQLKIKEIKNLSSDFRNTVDKEMDNTRRAVKTLQEGLGQNELDPALTVGKQDPYLLRLAVDRQVWKQVEEEKYLHQAYLNLESSGRELESIVVGEIQKAYGSYAKILKSEVDSASSAIEELRLGPLTMPKDQEWHSFVRQDDQFVDPDIPIRSVEHVHYPGRDHPSCQEIRAGLLERKSKYLKSYTAGWYVLSPTHLHEFKSADKGQAPVMSLYLPEQTLGSHSAEGGSSNKFILKGRQTGGMHRGHTWVFRAESHDTMMAWYEDIQALTERTPEERSNLVREHVRSVSRASRRSASSDGVVDEDDDEPFSANAAAHVTRAAARPDFNRRAQPPGGRFPSDLHMDAQRGSQDPQSPSSLGSGRGPTGSEMAGYTPSPPEEIIGADARWMRGGGFGYGGTEQTPIDDTPSHGAVVSQLARKDGVNPYSNDPLEAAPATPQSLSGAGAGARNNVAAANADGNGSMDSGTAAAAAATTTAAFEPRSAGGGPSQVPEATSHRAAAGLQGSVADTLPQVDATELVTPGQNKAEIGAEEYAKIGLDKVGRPTADRSNTGGLSNIHVPGEYPTMGA